MEKLVIAFALFTLVNSQAYDTWQNYHNGLGYGYVRENNFGRNPQWFYPTQHNQLQNNLYGSNVEWVCQNPKTRDMMIIASDNTRRPWQRPTVPSGNGNYHTTQPSFIDRETTGTVHNNNNPDVYNNNNPDVHNNNNPDVHNNNNPEPSPLPNRQPEINNNNNQPQVTPSYHGGEGLIDIRIAREE